MTRPIALVTADLHLDEHAWSDRPEISGDSIAAFEYITKYAAREGLPLIAAGDLIDKKANFSVTIGALRRGVDRVADSPGGLDFCFIQGQHELQERPWVKELNHRAIYLPERPGFVLEPDGSEEKTVVLHGLDWTPREQLSEKLEFSDYGECKVIAVMHQVTHEFMGSIVHPEMSVTQVNADVLIIGDYHVHKQMTVTNTAGKQMLVLSPGSTNMRAINEPPDKWFFVLNDDLSVTSHQIPTRPFLNYELSISEQLDLFVSRVAADLDDARENAIKEGAAESIAMPLVRVIYSGHLADAYRRIRAAVKGHGHLFTTAAYDDTGLELEPDEENQQVKEFGEAFDAGGLLGCLPLAVLQGDEPDVFQICEQLLSAVNPEEALAELRKEFLSEAKEADSPERWLTRASGD